MTKIANKWKFAFWIMFISMVALGMGQAVRIAIQNSELTKTRKEIQELRLNIIQLETKLAVCEREREADDLIKLNRLVNPNILRAVIMIESSNNPMAHNKSEGAVGLMQLRPLVYNKICGLSEEEAFDPVKNVSCGTVYLKHLLNRFNGNISRTLQYYNSGHIGNIKYIEKIKRELNCKEEFLCLKR